MILKFSQKKLKKKIWTLQNSGVTNIAIDRNIIYLKQDLIDDDQVSLIGFFWQKKTIEAENKEKMMQTMIDMLSDQNFLALFRENED